MGWSLARSLPGSASPWSWTWWSRRWIACSTRSRWAAEIEQWQRENTFLPPNEATPDSYPALYNMSAGMRFGGVIRPVKPELPDYVAVEMHHPNLEMAGQVGMWNMLWEAGQFRRRFFDEAEMSAPIAKIADRDRLAKAWERALLFRHATILSLLLSGRRYSAVNSEPEIVRSAAIRC